MLPLLGFTTKKAFLFQDFYGAQERKKLFNKFQHS